MDSEPQDIGDIINNARLKRYDHGLADYYGSVKFPDEVDRLRELVHGGKLIDLGCGSEGSTMELFAVGRLGAQGYIGVDIRDLGLQSVPERNIEFHQSDMLAFLSQQPDGSAAITINAINEDIIDPKHPGNVAYIKRLAEEIARVAHGYGVFGLNSPDIFQALEDFGIKKDEEISTTYFRLYIL